MEIALGSVIAERRLRVTGQPELDVRVRIGTPSPFFDSPHSSYYCPYQITGLDDSKVKYAGGVDGVQALELAIRILPAELDALRQRHPGLGWEDALEGDFGFVEGRL